MKNLIGETLSALENEYFTQRPIALEDRLSWLRTLKSQIESRRESLYQAFQKDFSKPAIEVEGTEIFATIKELDEIIDHLPEWVQSRHVPGNLILMGSSSEIVYDPKGVVLVISPWNYPLYLAVGLLAAAISAGNSVVLKPSE